MTEAAFLQAFGTFLIAMVRIGGALINLPAFGEAIVPNRIKIALSAFCSALILPHLLKTQVLPNLSVIGYGIMAAKELFIGLILGFIILIALDALKYAGELMGMQVGFSFVQVVDPESSRGQAILAEFMQVLGVLLFLSLNGHIIFMCAFMQSFDVIPLAGMNISASLTAEIGRLSAQIFWIGLQLSMPIVSIILISDVALGIIAKTVPRMNIFQVGFALKISFGLWLLTLLIPYFHQTIISLFHQSYGSIGTILQLMGGK